MSRLLLRCGASILAALVLVIAQCSSPVAGGATDSPNSRVAKVQGRALYADSTSAQHARVTLRRYDYFAQPGGLVPGRGADAVTDLDGFFSVDSIDTGDYFLEINDGSGMAVGVPLEISSDTILTTRTLQKVTSIGGTVTIQGANRVPVSVSVRGLERSVLAGSASGTFSLSDLPSGAYTVRIVPWSYEFASVQVDIPYLAPGDSAPSQSILLTPFAQEDYATWGSSRRLVVNTAVDGANITELVTGFPMLVRIDSTVLDFSEALPGGADLRFANASGLKLRYEIESWDAPGKEAAVWVLVDTIKPLDTTGLIMYWGKTGASDFSNGAAVFDTANGFAGVWHMQVDGGLVRDATAFANHGTPMKFDGNEAVPGCIGSALSADQSGNYVVVADKPELRLSRSLTISVWVHGRDYGRLLSKGSPSLGSDYDLYFARSIYTEIAIGIDSAQSLYTGGSAIPDSVAWNYVGAAYDGANFLFVMNSVATVPAMNWNGNIRPTASPLSFFATPTGGEHLSLPLDEIRVERVVRSQAWLKLCYENQRPGQVAVMFR